MHLGVAEVRAGVVEGARDEDRTTPDAPPLAGQAYSPARRDSESAKTAIESRVVGTLYLAICDALNITSIILSTFLLICVSFS